MQRRRVNGSHSKETLDLGYARFTLLKIAIHISTGGRLIALQR